MAPVTITDRHTISATWDRGATILDYQVGGTGQTVNLGDVVYLDDNNQVQQAIANALKPSHAFGLCVGVTNFYAETSAASGAWVAICLRGPVFGFIGDGFVDGQVLYLSKTVAGGLDTVAPATPAYDYVVGNTMATDAFFVDPGQSTPLSV